MSKNLNNSVTYHQSNTGAAAGTDDSWSLAALSASSANDSANATLVLPTPTGSSTFQVVEIQIDTSDLDSTLSATAAQQAAFKVMMTVNINNQGVLSASCEVQRAASATDTTLAIVDEAGHAQYLYFDDDSDGANDRFSQKHAAAWSSGDADDVEDKLSQNLSNSSVETAYATEIAATKNSIDGENVISSWSLVSALLPLTQTHHLPSTPVLALVLLLTLKPPPSSRLVINLLLHPTVPPSVHHTQSLSMTLTALARLLFLEPFTVSSNTLLKCFSSYFLTIY